MCIGMIFFNNFIHCLTVALIRLQLMTKSLEQLFVNWIIIEDATGATLLCWRWRMSIGTMALVPSCFLMLVSWNQSELMTLAGSLLAKKAIESMKEQECEEVVLETEVTNKGSLGLYEKLGFIKDKRLCRYYLNGVDAFRLKIFLPRPEELQPSNG